MYPPMIQMKCCSDLIFQICMIIGIYLGYKLCKRERSGLLYKVGLCGSSQEIIFINKGLSRTKIIFICP